MEGETYIRALFVHLWSQGKPGWMHEWSISRPSRRRWLSSKGAERLAWGQRNLRETFVFYDGMGGNLREWVWDRVFLQWSGDVFQFCGPRVLSLVGHVLQVDSNTSSALATKQKYLTVLQKAPAYPWHELPPASESKAEPTPYSKVPRTLFLLLLLYKPSNLITTPPFILFFLVLPSVL